MVARRAGVPVLAPAATHRGLACLAEVKIAEQGDLRAVMDGLPAAQSGGADGEDADVTAGRTGQRDAGDRLARLQLPGDGIHVGRRRVLRAVVDVPVRAVDNDVNRREMRFCDRFRPACGRGGRCELPGLSRESTVATERYTVWHTRKPRPRGTGSRHDSQPPMEPGYGDPATARGRRKREA